MNVSGPRAADDINLEEFERRLRAAGAQQANVEDPLVELARLVESSYAGWSGGEPSAAPVSEPEKRSAGSTGPIGSEELRPTIDDTEDLIPAASEADRAARRDYEFDSPGADDSQAAGQASDGRSRRWKLKVSALALAGLAMIGAVFALKGRVPGLPKDPPFIAAAQGPTKVQPPSDETVTASNDPGLSVLKDNAKAGSVKIISSEEQPVDLSAQGSPDSSPPAPANPPAAADQPKPPASASNATPVAATHEYASRASSSGCSAGHDVGIPRSQAGADRFLAAGRNADRRIESAGPEQRIQCGAGSGPDSAAARRGSAAEDDERCGRGCGAFNSQTRFAHQAFAQVVGPCHGGENRHDCAGCERADAKRASANGRASQTSRQGSEEAKA